MKLINSDIKMAEPREDIKIVAIVPAFNEERSIQSVVKGIKTLYPNISIVVVNDGSSDRTAEKAAASGARTITLPFNLGIGGAMQTGFKIAASEGYDIAIQVDGDAQHNPLYIKDLVKPLCRGELDMCIGSRFLSENPTFRSTFFRRIGIRIFSGLLRSLIHIRLTDPTSGFRAINRKLIRVFALNYPIDFPEPEAIKLAQRFGARIGEVPVKMRKRLGGTSSIRYFSTIYYMVKVSLAILIDTLRKPIGASDERSVFCVGLFRFIASVCHRNDPPRKNDF